LVSKITPAGHGGFSPRQAIHFPPGVSGHPEAEQVPLLYWQKSVEAEVGELPAWVLTVRRMVLLHQLRRQELYSCTDAVPLI
jgi:hypothetical protein